MADLYAVYSPDGTKEGVYVVVDGKLDTDWFYDEEAVKYAKAWDIKQLIAWILDKAPSSQTALAVKSGTTLSMGHSFLGICTEREIRGQS